MPRSLAARLFDPDRDSEWRSGDVRLALLAILALALLLRFWGVLHDLPFSYYGDELHLMKRAMTMGTGDLNPHWFHKPALLMYVLLLAYGTFFVCGWVVGRFESVDHFAAFFLADHGPFLLIGRLIVLAAGVALVYAVYRLGRAISGRPGVGLAGALVAAVMPPLVASSQHIKADTPCALLIVLSLVVYTGREPRGRPSTKRLVLASVLAGAAMGTKYYGIVLVPAFGLVELSAVWRRGVSLAEALRRIVLLVTVFVLGFFVVSPYNFLDPTWGDEVARKVSTSLSFSAEVLEVDSKTEYRPGLSTWLDAAGQFLDRLFDPRGLGLPLAAILLAGLVAGLSSRRLHGHWPLLALVVVLFVGASAVLEPYHAQLRHFTAIVPIICLFVLPGARAVAALVTRDRRRRRVWVAVLFGLVVVPAAVQAGIANQALMREDSRTVAYYWVLENLPASARLLADDDGPWFHPDERALARLRHRLAELPKGPFTYHQQRRLELLGQYMPAEARNVDFLGRPWWLARQKSDEEIAASLVDTDMSNPLISRVPRSLDEYRAEGVRYVLTTSIGRRRWLARFDDPELRFPDFVRFYESLENLGPIETLDPAEWGGKGPVIEIFDLGELPAEGPHPVEAER